MIRSTRVRRAAALLTSALGASVLALAGAAPAGAAVNTTGELTADDPNTARAFGGDGTCGGPSGADATLDRNFDVYPFFVTAAETVTIDLQGSTSGAGTLFDPWLQVYCNVFDPTTPAANLMGSDDDGGVGYRDSRVVLDLQPGVQYYAVATSFSADATGTYTLTMSGSATEGLIPVADTPRITVTAAPATAEEGGEPGAFVFSRSGDRFNTLTVIYSVTGTATNGTDYDQLSGIVNFPFGAATVTVPVSALADGIADDGETVTVNVEFGAYDRGQPQSATVTIAEEVADPCADAPDAGFTDVPDTNEHDDSIDCIAALGLAEGYPDKTYKPTLDVSRAQMASFVARLLARAGVELPASPPDAFTADDAGPPHELSINQLAAVGIFDGTTGEDGETYGVSDDMRRDDMAQILVNAYELITGGPMPAGRDAFTDDEGTDADGTGTDNEDAINALAAAGVVQGTGDGNYDPDGSVSRGQFASFFARYVGVLADAGIELTPASS